MSGAMLQKMARRMYEDEAKRVGYSDAQLAMWGEYPKSVRDTWEGRARSALAALQQPTDEPERARQLATALTTLVYSVRSVLAELGPGQSLRPAGAGKTNILVSDVNAAERVLFKEEQPK